MKKALTLMSTLVAMPLLAQAPFPVGSGPESAMGYSPATLPTHTIYRPEAMHGSYPVVLWGNGSCRNDNFGYREFLSEIASHGFIVVAIGPYGDKPAPRQQRPEDPAEWPPFETSYRQHVDALNWLEAVSESARNELAGHVDLANVAVMGHSCGGLQAVKASSDPRITTTLVLNSGLFPDEDQYMIRHEAKREALLHLHAPIAYFIGGETDIAYVNAQADWADLPKQSMPAINANMDVGHGATYQMPGGGPFAEGPLAWLKYQLKGDKEAAAMFVGEHCGLCESAEWQIKRHGL